MRSARLRSLLALGVLLVFGFCLVWDFRLVFGFRLALSLWFFGFRFPLAEHEDDHACGQQGVGPVVLRVHLQNLEGGQGRPPEAHLIGLVIDELVVRQRYGSNCHRCQQAVGGRVESLDFCVLRQLRVLSGALQPPAPQGHEQSGSEGVGAEERIACHDRQHEQHAPPQPTGRQGAIGPEQGDNRQQAQRGSEVPAFQLDGVNPVAHVDIGCQQQRHRHEQQHRPRFSDAERAPHEPHEQPPQGAQHAYAQRGIVEQLGEETAHVGQQSARHHHLLSEEQRCVEKQVLFLNLPQHEVLVAEQEACRDQQRQQPYQRGGVRLTFADD